MIIADSETKERMEKTKPENISLEDYAKIILLSAGIDELGRLKTDETELLKNLKGFD